MKKIFTSIFFMCSLLAGIAQPTTPAATPPTRNSTDYISIYSGVYSNIGGTDFFPSWGQSTQIQEFYVGADTMIKYSNFNYQGLQLASAIDVSNMTKLHLDLWTSNCTAFEVFLINTSPAPAVEQPISLTPTLNGWNSFDIDLSLYTSIALHNVGQIKLVSTPFGGPTVYLDNIYFYKTATTPTITNFTIPTKSVGTAPFVIPAPTSNSSGAFTYTSTNASVATVNGNMITIVGVGNTTIKATQAASGAYGAGTISTTFSVSTGLPQAPLTAAPVPTKAQANVISLYSNSYQNKTVDTWSAVWDQADISDTTIAGNSTKKYTNLVYSGIEFTTQTINVTNADYFHVDIWTPNATTFKIKLVDFGANGTYGGGDDKEHEYTVTPNPSYSNWISYDIPMSAFAGLTTKAHLAQMLFVSSGSTVYFDNVFFWATTAVLPVDIKSFNLQKNNDGVEVVWSVANEVSVANYVIERSLDGKAFEPIKTIAATNKNQYTVNDAKPINGTNYYRIKIVDKNGKFNYSVIKSIAIVNNKLHCSVYPNPTCSQLNVSINGEGGSLILTDVMGKIVLQKNNVKAGNTILNVTAFPKGVYNLSFLNSIENYSIKVQIQ